MIHNRSRLYAPLSYISLDVAPAFYTNPALCCGVEKNWPVTSKCRRYKLTCTTIVFVKCRFFQLITYFYCRISLHFVGTERRINHKKKLIDCFITKNILWRDYCISMVYMKIKQTVSAHTFALAILLGCLFTSLQAGASVKQSLSGKGESSSYGVGANGYFQGGHPESEKDNQLYDKFKNNGQSTNSSGWGGGGSSWGRGGSDGSDSDWKGLSVSLGKGGNSFAGPAGGDFNEAHVKQPLMTELHYDGTDGNTGLTFEKWHKDPTTQNWYDIDDTKRTVLKPLSPSQIPEPTSVLLLALGLFVIFTTKARQRGCLELQVIKKHG